MRWILALEDVLFALYDTETKNVEFILNTAKTAEEGAGPAAVQIVAPSPSRERLYRVILELRLSRF